MNEMDIQKTLDGTAKAPKNNVLITIQPRWADEILSGNKKWEYRRVAIHAEPGARLILYASGDMHAIVGEAIIERILNEPIDLLIKHTISEVPETEEGLRKSFAGHAIGHAIKVRNPFRYETPLTLDMIRRQIPQFNPPQGFYYIKDGNPLLEILRR